MAIDGDALELFNLLAEEGFGTLAADLLLELEAGALVDVDSGTVDDPTDLLKREAAQRRATVALEGGIETTRRYAEPVPEVTSDRREAVPDGEQLAFSLRFLRANLVEPLLALEEAERLGAEIRDTGGVGQAKADPAPFGASDIPKVAEGSDQEEPSSSFSGEAAREGDDSRPQGVLTIAFANTDRSMAERAEPRPRAAEIDDVLLRLEAGAGVV